MKFICIRECIWHHPDFDTPRRLLPDGGKTVYDLQTNAPRHLFCPVGEIAEGRAPIAEELATQTLSEGGQASGVQPEGESDEVPEQNPNPWAMSPRESLLAKSKGELLQIGTEYKLEEPEKFPNKVVLVEAILIKAGYTGEAVTGPAPKPQDATGA